MIGPRFESNKFMNNFAQSNGFVRIGFFALHTFPINVELTAVAVAAGYSTPDHNKQIDERAKEKKTQTIWFSIGTCAGITFQCSIVCVESLKSQFSSVHGRGLMFGCSFHAIDLTSNWNRLVAAAGTLFANTISPLHVCTPCHCARSVKFVFTCGCKVCVRLGEWLPARRELYANRNVRIPSCKHNFIVLCCSTLYLCQSLKCCFNYDNRGNAWNKRRCDTMRRAWP